MVSKAIEKVNKGGRPTKYYPEVMGKIEEYISSCGRNQTSLPTIEGLAGYLDVDSDTIRNWSRQTYPKDYEEKKLRGKLKHPEFFVTIKKLTDKQKQQLMDDGMYGGKEVNAAMAIFLLKVNHGLTEGTGVKVQVNVFDRLAKDDKGFVEGEEVNE